MSIQMVMEHAKRIAERKDPKVQPGMPARFTEACVPGDAIAQGDLNLEIIKKVPKGYTKVEKPTEKDMQLVPGDTQGSRHVLDSLEGVKLYRPQNWGEEGKLEGPVLVLTEERTILHPTHGAVTIPKGFTVGCTYQREWDVEQRAARRAAD